MIRCHARFADEKPATPHKPIVPMYPNIEVLDRLIATKGNVHALDYSPSF